MRIVPPLAGALLVVSAAAGCSGGDGDSDASGYCADIKAAKPTFDRLSSGDLSVLEKGFAAFHRLADESPDGLDDQWKVLDEAASSVEDSIKTAGLSFDDLPSIQSGQIPPGTDPTKLATFVTDLQKLNSTQFSDARAAIARQAKDECGVDLTSS